MADLEAFLHTLTDHYRPQNTATNSPLSTPKQSTP